MAEIRNYSLFNQGVNFSSSRPADLTCLRKLACTEIHCKRSLKQKFLKV